MNSIYELEYLNLYHEITNLNICFIDDVQFTCSVKDIKKIFPNNTIYDLSKIYKYYLQEPNIKNFSKYNMIVFLNDSKEELNKILRYFTGIIITKLELEKYQCLFVEKIDNYNIYEIE